MLGSVSYELSLERRGSNMDVCILGALVFYRGCNKLVHTQTLGTYCLSVL